MELSNIPDNSVDLVFADPPFNVGKKYGGKASNDRRDDYYEWCAAWIAECFRVLKPTGSMYLMTISRHVFKMGCEMEKHGAFVSKVEWRNVSASQSKRGFWSSTQSVLVFGKTNDYKFNTYAQTRTGIVAWSAKRREKAKGQLLDYWDDIPFVYSGSIRHPEAILEPGTKRKMHPAQMPIALASRCILFSTDEGDVVLDIFNGSGTTGVAAMKSKRKFIGIEKEPKYFEMAKERIEKEIQ